MTGGYPARGSGDPAPGGPLGEVRPVGELIELDAPRPEAAPVW